MHTIAIRCTVHVASYWVYIKRILFEKFVVNIQTQLVLAVK